MFLLEQWIVGVSWLGSLFEITLHTSFVLKDLKVQVSFLVDTCTVKSVLDQKE